MVKHCCKDIANNLYCTNSQDICNNKKTDDGKVVYFSARFREYGLPVKNSEKIASSYITIDYCPWCGTKLPESKRDEWFDELEKLGYESPFEQDIPSDYQSEKWYERTKKTRDGSVSSDKTTE